MFSDAMKFIAPDELHEAHFPAAFLWRPEYQVVILAAEYIVL